MHGSDFPDSIISNSTSSCTQASNHTNVMNAGRDLLAIILCVCTKWRWECVANE